MDEQTRMARFESMRRPPGLRKISNNKKLFIVHKDLQKQCAKSIQRHEFDHRIVTSEVRRQQNVMERKQEKILKQQRKFDARKEQTHVLLEKLENSHTKTEEVLATEKTFEVKPKYTDIIKAISHLSMPRSMKEKLRWECTVNPIRD